MYGFLLPVAVPESHNTVIHCFSWRKLPIKRKPNETLRDTVWAAPVTVTLYVSSATARRELQTIGSGLRMKHVGQHFTRLDTDHPCPWPGHSSDEEQVG